MKVIITEEAKKDMTKLGLDNDYQMKWWEHIWWPIERFLEYIQMIPRRVKWFCQRGWRGWAECDTWDFADYLAVIIRDGLKQLAKDSHGYPGGKEFPNFKAWQNKLKDISKAYDDYLKLDYFTKDYLGKIKKREEIGHRMKDLLKYFDSLWD